MWLYSLSLTLLSLYIGLPHSTIYRDTLSQICTYLFMYLIFKSSMKGFVGRDSSVAIATR